MRSDACEVSRLLLYAVALVKSAITVVAEGSESRDEVKLLQKTVRMLSTVLDQYFAECTGGDGQTAVITLN